MTFEEYRLWHAERWAETTALAPAGDVRKMAIPVIGLAGEVGETLEHFKKHIRDGKPLVGNIELKLELGDVFNYWLELVHIAGLEVEDVLDGNVEKLTARDAAKKVAA